MVIIMFDKPTAVFLRALKLFPDSFGIKNNYFILFVKIAIKNSKRDKLLELVFAF